MPVNPLIVWARGTPGNLLYAEHGSAKTGSTRETYESADPWQCTSLSQHWFTSTTIVDPDSLVFSVFGSGG